jgi:hypothetical protein
VNGERKPIKALLGGDPLHKLVKLGTLVVPRIVALICDLISKACFLIQSFIASFLAIIKVKWESQLVKTLLGDGPLHKLVKLGTLGVPTIVALISDRKCHTSFFVPVFVAGFVGMSMMIYHNLNRARKSA